MKCTSYAIETTVSEPIKIALCSDLHDNRFSRALDILQEEHPDLIAIPGDMGEDPHDLNARGIAFVSACTSIAPTVYALGNHDKAFNSHRAMSERIQKSDIILLDDTDIRFRDIWIGGLTSGFRNHKREGYFKAPPAPNLRWLDDVFCKREGFKLLLSHHPEYYPSYFQQRKIDLILSGHAHGGHWQLFGRGVLAPGQGFLPEYTHGLHENRLVISRGMGDHTFIPRWHNPREIVMIQLLPKMDSN